MTDPSFERRRNILVDELLNKNYIFDAKIERIFRKVHLEDFLPQEVTRYAYLDRPLPFYENRPMAAPHINAIFLQLLQIEAGSNYQILQLSSMGGYFAALLSELTNGSHIRIIEGDPKIVEVTRKNLERSGYSTNIEVVAMDPINAFQKFPKSDRIVLCGAVSSSIIDQITTLMPNNSILIAPVFMRPVIPIDQDMIRVTKSGSGQNETESFGKVSFILMQSESFQRWASKTQQLIFDQINDSLEEYFTTVLPREEPLLDLNLPEHIIEDFFAANTLYRRGFMKGAIFLSILAVKEAVQYSSKELLDLTKIEDEEIYKKLENMLSSEEMRYIESLLDIEKSIINFTYDNPPNMETLATMALDTASNFLRSRFKEV